MAFTPVGAAAGLNHQSLPGTSPYLGGLSAGGAAADFNNDGWVDIFALGGGGATDQLYINNGDGTFREESAAWGVNALVHSFGAAASDYDNDGDFDIFVTCTGSGDEAPTGSAHRLYRNNGNGTFTDVAEEAGLRIIVGETYIRATGGAWGDYDLDGDMDLYVTSYHYFGFNNLLFRNNGDGTFSDVTEAIGLRFNRTSGFFASWVDFNGDRYPELMVIGDTGTSRYFINNGGESFTQDEDVTRPFNNSMGFGAADIDLDGRLDMYVTGIWDFLGSGTGGGNQLMHHNPDGSFTNIALEADVADAGWAWAAFFADLDHDMLPDILCTNQGNRTRLWRNNGDLSFTNLAPAAGIDDLLNGRGMVKLDYDNDGDLDYAVFCVGQNIGLYRNDTVTAGQTPPDKNWLMVELDSSARTGLAPNGFGARMTARAGGVDLEGLIDGGINHCVSGPYEAHFGLADRATIDALQIRWPDGGNTTLVDVPANQRLVVEAPAFFADFDRSGSLDMGDVVGFLGAVSAQSLVADHNADWIVNFNDVLAFLSDYAAAR